MGVTIVVPALAETQQGHEPVIPSAVPSGKSTVSPEVRQRVDHPGRMQSHRHPEEYTLQKERRPPNASSRHPGSMNNLTIRYLTPICLLDYFVIFWFNRTINLDEMSR
jgi:hypothetical protein